MSDLQGIKSDISKTVLFIYYEYRESVKKNNTKNYFEIEVPVLRLNGIKYNFILKISTKNIKSCTFLVKSTMICDDGIYYTYYADYIFYEDTQPIPEIEDTKCVDYTIDDFETIYKECNQLLKQLKLNKVTGELYKSDIQNNKNELEYWRKLLALKEWVEDLQYATLKDSSQHIELKYEKCPVCNDITETRLRCNHILCIQCRETIYEKNTLASTHICPICRKSFDDNDLDDNLDNNLDDNLDNNLDDNLDNNLDDNLDDNIGDNLDDNIGDNLDDNIGDN